MNILRYFGSLSHKLKGMYVNRKEVVDSINEMLKLRCQRGERKNDRTVLMKSGCSELFIAGITASLKELNNLKSVVWSYIKSPLQHTKGPYSRKIFIFENENLKN
ncbi:hypothetical protein BMR1_03g02585 [Babesia microti strain RI]|uniref:Uncharacterized protein n=1 Tax=Babesia microti (strain RI) TaxID=1133968 RepID=A0A0K3ANL1_BABMR|nr:hypothetical protein BMR1_03g02585 [Babesia microti strain RI]CTQ41117.1 hypothetical protein BMR1_03g02585 [Babesia microti strain RI]|eukprot:XP_012649128.1 hypothetical protein BMR1_03g02585 [Babesia microti strain RI]